MMPELLATPPGRSRILETWVQIRTTMPDPNISIYINIKIQHVHMIQIKNQDPICGLNFAHLTLKIKKKKQRSFFRRCLPIALLLSGNFLKLQIFHGLFCKSIGDGLGLHMTSFPTFSDHEAVVSLHHNTCSLFCWKVLVHTRKGKNMAECCWVF